jgi:hypothetical protein
METAFQASRNEELSGATSSFGISLAVAGVANALLVVAKERSPRLMAAMKSATGHQWATHSALVLMIFLVLGAALARANGGRGVRIGGRGLIKTAVGGIAIGSFIIGGYYLISD